MARRMPVVVGEEEEEEEEEGREQWHAGCLLW